MHHNIYSLICELHSFAHVAAPAQWHRISDPSQCSHKHMLGKTCWQWGHRWSTMLANCKGYLITNHIHFCRVPIASSFKSPYLRTSSSGSMSCAALWHTWFLMSISSTNHAHGFNSWHPKFDSTAYDPYPPQNLTCRTQFLPTCCDTWSAINCNVRSPEPA